MNEKENEIYFIFHISKFFFPNLKFNFKERKSSNF